jgi:membrane protease YdiL (CAAX protease family)
LLLAGGVLAGIGVLTSPYVLGPREGPTPLTAVSVGVGILGGLCVLLGVGWIARAAGERGIRGYGSHLSVLGLTALAGIGAFSVLLPLVMSVPRSSSPIVLVFVLGTLLLDFALMAIVYLRVVRPGLVTWQEMGFSRVRLGNALRVGLVAAPLLFTLLALVQIILRALGIEQTQIEQLQGLRSATDWQFLAVAFVAAVVAPIAEEVYFRGYVFRAYCAQKGPIPAYLYSSALFAAVHLNPQASLPIFVMSLGLAALYHRTGSVVPGIVAHGFNNGLAFLALYLVR